MSAEDPWPRLLVIAHELGGLVGAVSMWAHVVATSTEDATQRARAPEALRAAAEEQARLVEELVSLVAAASVRSGT